ncbi:MAG: DUF2683 family protein [Candidatus Pacearchaeota archaeon]|nr:MAG: DUF2683 family protein [Candidatus Pacearchaeota archaeon]
MVQAIVNVDEKANRILNIVKAKYGLRDKSEAINKVAELYATELLEPDLRPEYIEKLKGIEKEKTVKVSNFRQRYLKKR